MEIILMVVIILMFVYLNNKINKIVILISDLSDKQTKVVVEFFVSKLQEKGILKNDEIESLYQDVNQKIKNEVRIDTSKK
jgi:hypothetical protein